MAGQWPLSYFDGVRASFNNEPLPFLPIELRELILGRFRAGASRRHFVQTVQNIRLELRRLRGLLLESFLPFPFHSVFAASRQRLMGVIRYIGFLLRMTQNVLRGDSQGLPLTARLNQIRNDMRQGTFINVNLYRDVRYALQSRDNYTITPSQRLTAQDDGTLNFDPQTNLFAGSLAMPRNAPGL